ncbi:MAG: response regulator [Pirellulaceae bacterium]
MLVVDDHAQARRSVVETLTLLGYEATGIESAREALRRLESNTFDLIITDLMMPGMDGLQFLDELQGRRDATPVVMVTAHGSVCRPSM